MYAHQCADQARMHWYGDTSNLRMQPQAVHMQIWTVWQSAVAAVHSFPQTPDVVAIVNAVAEEAGEPSAAAIQRMAVAAMF